MMPDSNSGLNLLNRSLITKVVSFKDHIVCAIGEDKMLMRLFDYFKMTW